ncbi:MAG: hypothetical protein QNI87_08480 [Erythrobacter sp.]|nr:hypothetical protein [Erythrobacter sp.]MDJ0978559.1 hypothetical protein [Erythrobacter sp.]
MNISTKPLAGVLSFSIFSESSSFSDSSEVITERFSGAEELVNDVEERDIAECPYTAANSRDAQVIENRERDPRKDVDKARGQRRTSVQIGQGSDAQNRDGKTPAFDLVLENSLDPKSKTCPRFADLSRFDEKP